MSIIDYLQPFTFAKKMEVFLKSKYAKANEISVLAPALYAERFVKFMRTNVFTNPESMGNMSEEKKHMYIDEQTKEMIKEAQKNMSHSQLFESNPSNEVDIEGEGAEESKNQVRRQTSKFNKLLDLDTISQRSQSFNFQ